MRKSLSALACAAALTAFSLLTGVGSTLVAQVSSVLIGSCPASSGTGTPEGSRSGKVCSTYLDESTGFLYTKTSGAGNTGWAQAGSGGGGGTGAINGNPIQSASVATNESTSSTSYVDLTTVGPSVTATTGSTVTIWISANANKSSTGNSGFISVAVSGASTVAASDANAASQSSAIASGGNALARSVTITGLTPGVNTFTMKYRGDGGTWSFSTRTLSVDNGAGGIYDPGSLVLLDTKTAATSATIDFTSDITATYDDYIVKLVDVIPATASTDLLMLVSTDNGATWASTTYAWAYNFNGVTDGTTGVSTATAQAAATLASGVVNATTGITGTVEAFSPASGGDKQFRVLLTFKQPTPKLYHFSGGAFWQTATAYNALRFKAASGNLTSGSFRLYGVAKTAQAAPSTVQTGAWSSRPAAAVAGRVYLPSDGFSLGRDNGSTFDTFGPLSAFTQPPAGVWSWLNQGSSTITEAKDAMQLVAAGTSSATSNIVARVKTAPATPYTITAQISPPPITKPFIGYGLVFRQNGAGTGTGRILTFWWCLANSVGTDVGGTMRVEKWSGTSTFSASYQELRSIMTPRWFRIADDGTNVKFSVSGDGQNWIQVTSQLRLDYLLQGADQVGFMAFTTNQATPNVDVPITLLSWKEQ